MHDVVRRSGKETGKMIKIPNNKHSFHIGLVFAFYLFFRLIIVVFTATTQTMPLDLNDHYAYAVKNTVVKNDFYGENPNLLQLKKHLPLEAGENREYHQIFCLYHPLYTLGMELIHNIFDISYKKCLFVMQSLSQVLLGIVFLLFLKSLKFDSLSIIGVFLLLCFNWGMDRYFFYGMPKHFLPIFAFLAIVIIKRFERQPAIAITSAFIVLLTAVTAHIMAYSFLLIPIGAVCAYGLFHKQKNYFVIGITLLAITFSLAFLHKELIDGGYLPGYMSNRTPFADTGIYFSTTRFTEAVRSCCARTIDTFSGSCIYLMIFLAGFFYGIWVFFHRKQYLLFWVVLSFNIIPLMTTVSLSSSFSVRLLPMALLMNLAVMCEGYLYILNSFILNKKDSLNFLKSMKLPSASALFIGLIIFMNVFQLKTFLRNFRAAAYGQCYDSSETLHRAFISQLSHDDVIGIANGEFILLSAIYNGLIHNPIVYQKYYSDESYPVENYIDKMTYCIGMVPWVHELGKNNSLKIYPNDELILEYNFIVPERVKGITLVGNYAQGFEEAIVKVNNKRYELSKRHTVNACQFLFPDALCLSGTCTLNLKMSKTSNKLLPYFYKMTETKTRIEKILWLGSEGKPEVSGSFDWDVLSSIVIISKSNFRRYNWNNSVFFGKHRKDFTVMFDDGFSFISKINQ